MLKKQRRQLYVVKDEKVETPKRRKDLEQMKMWFRESWQHRRRNILILLLAFAAVIVIFTVIHFQTYTEARISETYKVSGAADNNYVSFADGIIKYGRDGIAYLDEEGEEQWNVPYQIKTPFVERNSVSAVVADKGGNDIMVFQESGLKGEIHTTLPIEKVAVSEQGIVSVILKNESTPQIICYDSAGNILVEHKASFSGTGYPMDVALSADGQLLQVVYLSMEGSQIKSRVVYYNFGKEGEEKADHQVTELEYKDSIMVSGFFMNESVSVAMGDNCFTIFEGKTTPKEVVTVTLDKEVKSIFHDETYIGLVLKNEGKTGYELRLYNKNGKAVLTEAFSGDYKDVKIEDGQVIMYDGQNCCIIMKSGIKKFEGTMHSNILEMIPISGVNQYIVVNANGMEKVRLVK